MVGFYTIRKAMSDPIPRATLMLALKVDVNSVLLQPPVTNT